MKWNAPPTWYVATPLQVANFFAAYWLSSWLVSALVTVVPSSWVYLVWLDNTWKSMFLPFLIYCALYSSVSSLIYRRKKQRGKFLSAQDFGA